MARRIKFSAKRILSLIPVWTGAVLVVSLLFPAPSLAIPPKSDTMESFLQSPGALPSAQAVQQDPGAAILALADARFRQGAWAEAAQYSAALLHRDPQNLKARGILGAIQALTGQRKEAEGQLKALAEVKEQGFFVGLIHAVLKAQEGKFAEAEQELWKALSVDSQHPVAMYYRGSLHLAQGRVNEAQKSFEAVLAFQSDFPAALAGLGEAYARQDKLKDAARYYEKAVDQAPDVLLYRKQLVDIYKKSGQKEAEARAIKEFLYHSPGVRENYLARAMQLLSQGSYQEAVKEADKLLGIYKKIPEALYIKAAAEANLEKAADAEKDIQAFIAQRWGVPQAHHYAGMCLLALGETDKAELHFKVAVAIEPGRGTSFVPMTVIEQIRGNYGRAMEGLGLALKEGEPPALIHYLRGHVALAKGDTAAFKREMEGAAPLMPGLDKAGASTLPNAADVKGLARERNLMALYFFNGWYGKAGQSADMLLKMDAKDRFAWYYKALSATAQKGEKKAEEAFTQLLKIEPRLLAAHMGLGQVYTMAGDHKKAAASFNKAVEMDPKNTGALLLLGDAYARANDPEKAIAAYDRAAKADPKLLQAHKNLAMILSSRPEALDRALEHARKAEALSPQDPQVLDIVGWVHVQRGEIAEAVPKLEGAAKMRPQDPLVLYHLGVAYYRNRNPEGARKALEKALGISKAFPGADEAKEILKKMGDRS